MSDSSAIQTEAPFASRSGLFPAITALGISAFVVQIVLLREILAALAGNELALGIALGSWFLLTGVGAALGRFADRLRRPVAWLIAAQTAVAVLPLLEVFLLRTLRNVVFTRGADVGLTEIVASVLVLLAPYCLLAGFLLTLAGLLLTAQRGPHSIGRVYFLDNLGDILGGLLMSCVLIWWSDHFLVLLTPAVLNLGCAAWLAWHDGRRASALAIATILAATFALVAACGLDAWTVRRQYRPQDVVFHGHSPYARLVVTRSAGQHTFFANSVNLFSTQNVEQVEETVHYAMAQRPDAQRVLLISGGIAGTARELLKYPQAKIDYVELDRMLLDAARRILTDTPADPRLDDPRIEVIESDPRQYVRRTARQYDVIIVDESEPSTAAANRFYTREFMGELARVLRADGVVCFTLGAYGDFIGDELARVVAVTQRTLHDVFPQTLLVPGYRIYLLGSRGALTSQIAARLEEHGIATRFVNRHYLREALRPARLAQLESLVDAAAPVNRDFSPVLCYCHLRYWMREFQVRFGLLEGLLLIVLAAYLVRIRPVPLMVFSTGLCASALEVVLLVAFQSLYGCVYQRVAVIVAMFMLGLGTGSAAMNRWLTRCQRRHLAWIALALAALAVAVPALLGRLELLCDRAWLGQATIAVLTWALGLLVGLAFPLAGKCDFDSVTATAARLYTADYLGAALGALLVSTLLIPLLGVNAVCWACAGLSFLAALAVLVGRR